ncbi:MAG TPA: TRAP transporter fused permease subunit [Rubrobacteraceae bacterium]|nr:TRAP transporter fused permease subunit [Rubrobacteraceae bacterium]
MSDERTGERPGDRANQRTGERVRLEDPFAAGAEGLIEEFEAERPARHLDGLPKFLLSSAGVALSCYALFWVLNPIPAQVYRTSFLALALAMTFVLYRAWGSSHTGESDGAERRSDNPGITDYLFAVLSVVSLGYTLVVFDEFVRRAARPDTLDLVFGAITILLVLEATRRTVGWILPAICAAFIAYAYLGALIPDWARIGHVGYGPNRIVGQTYMGLEGLFGVPLDVAATYLVLFTIYGAVLEYSGAGKYFIDVSFAAFGQSRSGPGRTTTVAGFLLGTVSGSGTATTVTLGSVAWPILRRAGYPRAEGGGVLAAAGIGAILSPPTLGAAAFIIAEFLGVSYLQVLLYALIPSLLYYLGIILAIEADARRFRTQGVDVETPPLGYLLWRYGYHFSSLLLIVVLMAIGLSPFRAVFYATIAAFLLSFLNREHRMGPQRIWAALVAGAMGVLPVAATCAAAGIIVAVVTLTGLGLKLSSIIIALAGGSLLFTALYSAVAILVLGLAVPVTASFIISAVVIAPAFTELGVPTFAAYMFVFYYAVLSEVSPPTALAAVAASAITGGNAFKTMMLTWKYTLPAFLVPFAFVLSPNGQGLLLQGSPLQIGLTLLVSSIAVAALAVATGAWLFGPARIPERVLCGAAALLLLYLEPFWVGVGLAVLAVGVVAHLVGRRVAGELDIPGAATSSNLGRPGGETERVE